MFQQAKYVVSTHATELCSKQVALTVSQAELAVTQVLAFLLFLNHASLLLHLLEEVGQHIQGHLLSLHLGDRGRQVGPNSLHDTEQIDGS